MNIFTSYYINLSNINTENIVPISIAGVCHHTYAGLEYKKLAPKYWFFTKYKAGFYTEADYEYYYENEVLCKLNPIEVIETFKKMSGNLDVVLLCYEKPGDFCHRHLVAKWLTKTTSYIVKEL